MNQQSLTPQEAFDRAVAALGSSDPDEAVAYASALAKAMPDNAEAWKLLGKAEYLRGNMQAAGQCLTRVTTLAPTDVDAWWGLGECFLNIKDWATAFQVYLKGIQANPDRAALHDKLLFVIGCRLPDDDVAGTLEAWKTAFVGGDLDRAVERLDGLDPASPGYRTMFRNLAQVLFRMGREEDSVDMYSKSTIPLADEGGKDERRAALEIQYKDLAGDYDINSLQQAVPKIFSAFVRDVTAERKGQRIFDGACGTGLVGVQLKPYAARMAGADISQDMIDKADEKGLYDHLVHGDLVSVMETLDDTFDLVTCCAALNYSADLSGFLAASNRILDSGGMVIFSVDPCSDDWEVRRTGETEYCHSRRYIRGLAADVGLDEVAIRILEHRVYPGFYCAFRKA